MVEDSTAPKAESAFVHGRANGLVVHRTHRPGTSVSA